MAISVRTRFEVFKRDDFCCQYCGRRSPDVVLEVDHIVPICDGGADDPINLQTSCWDCNRGKGGVPLAAVVTGEDPHDRAILLLERERQLKEYNVVLAEQQARIQDDGWELWRYWQMERGNTKKEELETAPRWEIGWLLRAVEYCPKEQIRAFMDYAINRRMDRNLRYVCACVRNWRYEHQANKDMGKDGYPG